MRQPAFEVGPHPPPDHLPVRVVRSARRRRTIAGRMVDGTLEVLIPDRTTAADEQRYVADMVQRFARRHRSDSVDLPARADQLRQRYDLPGPTTIRWVENMAHRWGSCTKQDRSIRICSSVAGFPSWVLDAVIIHELAHLVVPNHSAAFWELANRYPKMERARGYLIARSGLESD